MPRDEARRLRALHALEILDTPAEPEYDDLAALAASVCRSPIAAVNFVDGDRHWTKAIIGVEDGQGSSVPNGLSFCASTVATRDGVMVVPDAKATERWRDHPAGVGFYAGASIVVSGERVGVICVFGPEAREVSARDQADLETLARQASAQLELRRRNAELRRLAVTDPLTGLANRTLLYDRLQQALGRRRRGGGPVGVLYCDVDDFKAVNDQHGHEAGDRLLCEIAERLRAATRATDTVARIAGDEFVIVCPALPTRDELGAIVQRVVAGTPNLSVGAVIAEPEETAAAVLSRADRAMYAVKTARRQRTA
jgi:diguanylate cyclase (GGDEF)-like protein